MFRTSLIIICLFFALVTNSFAAKYLDNGGSFVDAPLFYLQSGSFVSANEYYLQGGVWVAISGAASYDLTVSGVTSGTANTKILCTDDGWLTTIIDCGDGETDCSELGMAGGVIATCRSEFPIGKVFNYWGDDINIDTIYNGVGGTVAMTSNKTISLVLTDAPGLGTNYLHDSFDVADGNYSGNGPIVTVGPNGWEVNGTPDVGEEWQIINNVSLRPTWTTGVGNGIYDHMMLRETDSPADAFVAFSLFADNATAYSGHKAIVARADGSTGTGYVFQQGTSAGTGGCSLDRVINGSIDATLASGIAFAALDNYIWYRLNLIVTGTNPVRIRATFDKLTDGFTNWQSQWDSGIIEDSSVNRITSGKIGATFYLYDGNSFPWIYNDYDQEDHPGLPDVP